MLRVAMLSKWHVHAEDYCRQIQENNNAQVTCIWDENEARGREWAAKIGVPFFADLDELLRQDFVDAVVVDTPTSLHKEVIIKAANAKKHIFTEKVVAFTVKDALEIKRAVTENQVQFVISFPQMTTPAFIYAKNAVENGAVGDITMMRVRNGHNGATAGWLPDYWYDPATTGGGAMMDLGCHPMYLSRWFLGNPVSIRSAFTYYTGRPVEDSAVCSVVYENNAIAVVESSLASYHSPYIMEIYGTKGSVFIREDLLEIKSSEMENGGVTVDPETLEKTVPSAIWQFVAAGTQKVKPIFDIDLAIGLTELMEGAYLAAKENRTVYFSELSR